MQIYFIGGRADKNLIEESKMKNPNYEKRVFILKDGSRHTYFVQKGMPDSEANEKAEIYRYI
ncbi:hypothetical protein [Acinetobacter baumannii]|uniref:hypothetical protein n=1 Tax=Acinetobacter baumannii TaxID=470 RepID=UPI0007D8BF4E|nr:hypothetical protein [Acinetobacter baumannii]EKT7961229.1 hypothetical protein [Acinetobacter baumannii]EKU0427599.1 hypothetical protein [Acinetobacter baumannii]EKV4645964.1 hypothetical protein [Acinetobacter baumannii]EKV6479706.1 hypothetical protein [Acinetobacter baumannii]EKV7758819.1 hypothetical protein [Acinetobacter baumannii]